MKVNEVDNSCVRFGLSDREAADIRRQLHNEETGGFVVIRDAVSQDEVSHLRQFWLDKSIDREFSNFIANREVSPSSPNYFYSRPSDEDRVYCCFHWNRPPDQLTHELAYLFHMVRNILEGFPCYHGLGHYSEAGLQYRVCNHRSNDNIVYPHADYMEMERRDPAANHKFDPRRLQLTLVLSTAGEHYNGDGFVLSANNGEEFILGDSDISAGDLLIWRFNNLHEVRNVKCSDEQTGFMRIIFPVFDIDLHSSNQEVTEEVGRLGSSRLIRVFGK